MVLRVPADDVVAAGLALRRLGRRLGGYTGHLDARMTAVAGRLDDDVAQALRQAWADLADALDELTAGFQTYGGALVDVAGRFSDVDRQLAQRAPR